VVDADHAQGRVWKGEVDWHGGLVEGGRDVVDGDGVVGIGSTL
jgi:hypothetical protein